ncbi:MAG: outer membrane beta-barrel protein [Bacteroidota bacterium]
MKIQQLAPFVFVFVTAAASAEGFYGVGEMTHSNNSLNRSNFDNELTANGATGLSSSDHGNSNQFRLQGGYRFNENLAVEAGYIDFGKAKYTADYAGGSAQGKVKAGGMDVAALLALPLTDRFSVFGKAGVVAARVKSTLVADAPAALASGNTSTTVIRPLLGVGASYKLTQNVDLRADFDHVNGLGKALKTGKMDDNMVSFGVGYNF